MNNWVDSAGKIKPQKLRNLLEREALNKSSDDSEEDEEKEQEEINEIDSHMRKILGDDWEMDESEGDYQVKKNGKKRNYSDMEVDTISDISWKRGKKS